MKILYFTNLPIYLTIFTCFSLTPRPVSSVATKVGFLGGVAGMERNAHGGATAWFTVPLASSDADGSPPSVYDVTMARVRSCYIHSNELHKRFIETKKQLPNTGARANNTLHT